MQYIRMINKETLHVVDRCSNIEVFCIKDSLLETKRYSCWGATTGGVHELHELKIMNVKVAMKKAVNSACRFRVWTRNWRAWKKIKRARYQNT